MCDNVPIGSLLPAILNLVGGFVREIIEVSHAKNVLYARNSKICKRKYL